MAKRKRLTPANPDYLNDDAKQRARPAPPPHRVPIADVAREASATAAMEEMAETLARARGEGRMVLDLPLSSVRTEHLVRDRVVNAAADMAALIASIRARGQQTPVEVVALGGDRYGLISGWRRCQALAQLHEETGEARFGTVLALLRSPAEASDAYLSMVEENEIRVGLSYFERARIAAKAVEQGVFETEKRALLTLFSAASRAKRSKIRSFLPIVAALDGTLRFPEALNERSGLALSRALSDDPELGARLRAALKQAEPADGAAEQACLRQVLTSKASLKPPLETKNTPLGEDRRYVTKAGVAVRLHGDGAVTLSGAGFDEARRAALLAWLEQIH